ncbi:diguanylate cyclase (GGDEF)-like protein [Krasilnikovia cinnamomea]|uniref:Diguanylate cyclase (GGDEF)-like protein n=1 Tax=Krasilnikovia cinnamomea TaxID=349313 RepID=A0A4Q7ZCI8_9ACTN|nr:EAL domain-containing protein [Krasilnikovia cinnamomea]RZU48372.1 diguanylate cyclase (GGDEF)-like protein [Krasilnikovia cinnamomea]
MSAAQRRRVRGGHAAPAARRGLAPVAGAAATVAGALAWLALRDPHGPVPPGYAAGLAATAVAAFACHRIGSMIVLPRPVRSFWKRLSHTAMALFLASATAIWEMPDTHQRGMPPLVAAPLLVAVALAVMGFLQLPRVATSALRRTQLALDGATVAMAGALIFWFGVLDLAPAGIARSTQVGAALVGVGGLLALVVIGKAASSHDSLVPIPSLRTIAVAPLIAVIAAAVQVVGDDASRLMLLALGMPTVGTMLSVAAYLQLRGLDRPAPPPGRARCVLSSVLRVMPLVAVAGTAILVITVSARQLNWHQRALVTGAVLIVACVAARQLLGLRERARLLSGVRAKQAELEHLAMHDPLTGLANRARFSAVLAERLDAHLPASVLLIDLDDFKMVNETLGHAVGDQLLYEVAQRLLCDSAPGFVPARLGGDEFALLLDVDTPDAAEQAAARIVAALAVPFRVGEHHLLAHASVGVAPAEPGERADEVLRNADIAMYAAKDAGKASWARFEPRMRAEVVNHARLGSELHNALVRRELYLLYQPVYDIVTGQLAGVEALVRWEHPQRGNVPPGDFIGVAERSGLIVPMGSWVLRTACRQLSRWQAEYGGAAIARINVNVAARQLREASFVDEVTAVLRDTGLQPGNLVLEVTESSVLDGPHVRETLEALHELGVRLALDDFGTGQSSLSLLRAVPVDVLKLDKSFVDGICEGADRGRLAVAAAVAQLAEYLQLSAVAEGIESADQMNRLREMGYRLGQGFHLGRPLPADEVGAIMARSVPADGTLDGTAGVVRVA